MTCRGCGAPLRRARALCAACSRQATADPRHREAGLAACNAPASRAEAQGRPSLRHEGPWRLCDTCGRCGRRLVISTAGRCYQCATGRAPRIVPVSVRLGLVEAA